MTTNMITTVTLSTSLTTSVRPRRDLVQTRPLRPRPGTRTAQSAHQCVPCACVLRLGRHPVVVVVHVVARADAHEHHLLLTPPAAQLTKEGTAESRRATERGSRRRECRRPAPPGLSRPTTPACNCSPCYSFDCTMPLLLPPRKVREVARRARGDVHRGKLRARGVCPPWNSPHLQSCGISGLRGVVRLVDGVHEAEEHAVVPVGACSFQPRK